MARLHYGAEEDQVSEVLLGALREHVDLSSVQRISSSAAESREVAASTWVRTDPLGFRHKFSHTSVLQFQLGRDDRWTVNVKPHAEMLLSAACQPRRAQGQMSSLRELQY